MAKTPEYLDEPARRVPVAAQVDVLVCGGGPAGLMAAVAAARHGASTMLLEQYGCLGGMAAISLVGPIHAFNAGQQRIVRGLAQEFVDRMVALGGAVDDPRVNDVGFDPEALKLAADRMASEAGVRVRFHTFVSAPIVEAGGLRGVIVESKSGRQAILAKLVIDATGDGDIAARAGAPYEKGHPQTGAMQNLTMEFRLGGVTSQLPGGAWPTAYRDPDAPVGDVDDDMTNASFRSVDALGLKRLLAQGFERGEVPHFGGPFMGPLKSTIRPGEVTANMTRHWGDATDVEDLSRMEIEAREHVHRFVDFLRRRAPGFSQAYLIDTPAQIGVRETRRIMGEYVLTGEDVVAGRRFPDGIARGSWFIDIHPVTPSIEHTPVVKMKLGTSYDIPYRCLVPRGVENLLTAGRCISGTHEAHASYRVMATCMAIGQAAGTAAALCVEQGIAPRQLDAAPLRQTLTRDGAYLGEAAPRPEPPPVAG